MLNIRMALFRSARVLMLGTARHTVEVERAAAPDFEGYIFFDVTLDGRWVESYGFRNAMYGARQAYHLAHHVLRRAERSEDA